MARIKNQESSNSDLLSSIAVFLLASIATVVLFKHRSLALSHSLPYPDNDYEGTLWNVWFQAFSDQKGFSYLWNNYFSFPYYSDLSYLPMDNFFFDFFSTYLKITGRSLENLVFITNVFSLATYPLCVLATYHLARRLDLGKPAALLAGIAFAFSFDHVMSGRGIMVFGSYFLIPWSLSALIGLVEKKRFYDCCVFAAVYGCLLATDAYYGFYTAIAGIVIAPAMLLTQPQSLAGLFRLLKVSVLAVLLVVLLGLKYLVPYSHFLFSEGSRSAIARVINFSENLISINAFLYQSPASFFWTKAQTYIPGIQDILKGGSLISYTAALLSCCAFLCFFMIPRKHKIVLVCMLVLGFLSISIVTNISFGESIRVFYFENFALFRSVGRINRIISLVLAISAGIGFHALSVLIARRSKLAVHALLALVASLVFAEGMNEDSTWRKTVDTRNIEHTYRAIKEDKDIRSVASFPREIPYVRMVNYIQIGQIFHEKRVNGSLDPQSRYARDLVQSNEITPGILDTLIKQGYDAILIYERLYQAFLKTPTPDFMFKDERLEVLDHRHSLHPRTGMPTVMDSSFDVIIFKVKEQYRTVAGNDRPPYAGSFRGNLEQLPYPLLEKYRIAVVEQGGKWPRLETFIPSPETTKLHHDPQDKDSARHYFFLIDEVRSLLLGVLNFAVLFGLLFYIIRIRIGNAGRSEHNLASYLKG